MRMLLCPLIAAYASLAAAAQPQDPSSKPPEQKARLRVVVVGAHCDDPECGTGGLVALLTQAGHEVILAYATTHRGERKIDGQPEDTVRRRESSAACKVLGATPKFFPYKHESLFADPPTIKAVSDWLKEVKPDIVLTHWPIDTHPNHHVTSSLIWQCYDHGGQIWGQEPAAAPPKPADELARGDWNLYFYEVNTFTKHEDLETLAFTPTLYLDIGRVRDIKKKAVDCFPSQARYDLWTVQDNMHMQRGAECGVKYAEAYFLVEAKKGRPLLPVSFLPRK
jgi:LmbE family N-acetylglucosaminyl deacetylase